ncbi:MAG: DUF4350 domain-containing protein [Cyclobacteriaceae bacterium]
MKKDWKYIMYIGLLAGLLLILMLSKNKQYDWRVTLAHEDKNPYGTYALNELLPEVIKGDVKNSYQTLYELKDTLQANENILILSSSFSPGKEDTEMLLTYAGAGATIFISANDFYGSLADTLGLATSDSFFEGENTFEQIDSAFLYFVSPVMDSTRQFQFKRGNVHNYFSKLDSAKATVIATNDFHQPVMLRISKGKGAIILNSTPMVFTNIHLLNAENHEFASTLLSYLPKRNTYWTEYYQLGRMEIASPLRFVLTNEPLRWAYYISIISLLLFMIFEAKRKQRIIPIIKPLTNTTLEFIATIGNLYFQRGDHKNIAEKKIQFLLDQVRSHYMMSGQLRDEGFVAVLTKKSGVPEKTVRELVSIVNHVSTKEKITGSELTDLNYLIEKFQQKK